MPDAKDVIRHQLESGQHLIEMLTADLTDEEYFKPAAKGTNHVAWILLHVACTEDWVVSTLTESQRQIPAEIHEAFSPGSTCQTTASRHPPLKRIGEIFNNAQARLLEALSASDLNTWDDPSPEGFPREFFPTVGVVWSRQGAHLSWHIGQIATCRAAMGKKRAFV